MTTPEFGVRWTVGDISPLGFEALRLSIWGAVKILGLEVGLAVCVNSMPAAEARGYDLAEALEQVLRQRPVRISSELDEQGMQAVPLISGGRPISLLPRTSPYARRSGLTNLIWAGQVRISSD